MFRVFSFLHQLLLFEILHSHRHLLLPANTGIPKVNNTWHRRERTLNIDNTDWDVYCNLTIKDERSKIFVGFFFWSSYSRGLCCQRKNNFSSELAEKLKLKLSGWTWSDPAKYLYLSDIQKSLLPMLGRQRQKPYCLIHRDYSAERDMQSEIHWLCHARMHARTHARTHALLKDKMLNRWLRANQTFSFSLQFGVHMDRRGQGGQTNSPQSLWCASAGVGGVGWGWLDAGGATRSSFWQLHLPLTSNLEENTVWDPHTGRKYAEFTFWKRSSSLTRLVRGMQTSLMSKWGDYI